MQTLTANVGIGVLKSALRLQKNYVEYVETKQIEKLASGCYSCTACLKDPQACECCTKKVYETILTKKYINEKNRYGSRHTLKKYGLLLFLYAHFQAPDQMGHTYIDVDQAAQELGCDKKTIRNNLKLLNRYGYITLGQTPEPGLFQLFIKDYRSYFKKASENGRGYVTIAKEIFAELIGAESINEIRLILRNLLFSVENAVNEFKGRPMKRTYRELQRELPHYCTKKGIRKMLEKPAFEKLFEVAHEKKWVEVKVKDAYAPQLVVERLRQECFKNVRAHVDKLNKECREKHTYPLHVSAADLTDISYIGLRYPIEIILNAIDQIQKTMAIGTEIKELGALVRNIANANMRLQAC